MCDGVMEIRIFDKSNSCGSENWLVRCNTSKFQKILFARPGILGKHRIACFNCVKFDPEEVFSVMVEVGLGVWNDKIYPNWNGI